MLGVCHDQLSGQVRQTLNPPKPVSRPSPSSSLFFLSSFFLQCHFSSFFLSIRLSAVLRSRVGGWRDSFALSVTSHLSGATSLHAGERVLSGCFASGDRRRRRLEAVFFLILSRVLLRKESASSELDRGGDPAGRQDEVYNAADDLRFERLTTGLSILGVFVKTVPTWIRLLHVFNMCQFIVWIIDLLLLPECNASGLRWIVGRGAPVLPPLPACVRPPSTSILTHHISRGRSLCLCSVSCMCLSAVSPYVRFHSAVEALHP